MIEIKPKAINQPTRSYFLLSLSGLILSILSKLYSGPFQATVRGNVDDALIVIAVYFCLRTFFPKFGVNKSLGGVLILAFLIELLQGLGVFHPEMATAATYWLGTAFDWKDLVAYLSGAMVCAGIEGCFFSSCCSQR